MKMDTKYNYELIEDYLNGLLSEEASKKISALIETDAVARDIANGILLLKNKFKTDEATEEYLNERLAIQNNLITQNNRKSLSWLKVAATIVLVLVSGLVIYNITANQNGQELVAQALEVPYPMIAVSRGDDTNDDLNEAISAYESRNFAKAAASYTKLEQSTTIKFYLGLSYLYNDNLDEAIAKLSDRALQESRFSDQCEWYLALAYFKAGEANKSKAILHGIANNDKHYVNQEARDLLNSME